MISHQTVLVLGAGASIPHGFPSARDLKNTVCGLGPESLYTELGISLNRKKEFQDALWQSAHSSVGACLQDRPEFTDLGKLLMADVLIRNENTANLFKHELHWYEYLLQRMRGSFRDFGQNALSIITFNYDRSLEHFLFTALTNCYGKAPEDVASVLLQIPIIHVYGQLGFLEWQARAQTVGPPTPGPTRVRNYDPTRMPGAIDIAASGITIMAEGTEHSPELAAARKLLLAARNIYFLGFSYHDANMPRLGFGPSQRDF